MHPDTSDIKYDIDIDTDLKMAVNNLIWMWGPDDLSLGNAKKISLKICGILLNPWEDL